MYEHDLPEQPGYIEIVSRGFLKQKFHARFVADNGETLAVTEKYHNLKDLDNMLAKYYPAWEIEEPE